MAVSEKGGKEEAKRGYPFAGRSGEVLDAYLKRIGMHRGQLYIDNVYPFWTGPGDPEPSPREVAYNAWRLKETLARLRPRLILALGRLATRFFCGPAIDLDTYHGIPRRCAYGIVLPAYHPASAMHDSDMAGRVLWDLQQFKRLVDGEDVEGPAVDEIQYPAYVPYAVTGGNRHIACDLDETVAFDTEGSIEDLVSVQTSTLEGHARIYRREDLPIGTPENPLVIEAGNIVAHGLMHDLSVCMTQNIELRGKLWCTQSMARHLRLVPIALKPLARRELGMPMREYMDVVAPYYRKNVREYVERAIAIGEKKKWNVREEILVFDKQTRKWRISAPHSLQQRLKAIITTLTKNPKASVAPRWKTMPKQYRQRVTKALKGEKFPSADQALKSVPRAEADAYMGMDPDATFRLFPKLHARLFQMDLLRCHRVDMDALPLFAEMQRNGLRADRGHFERIRPDIVESITKRTRAFSRRYYGGQDINLNSPPQVAKFLYEHLKLRPPHMTRKRERGAADEKALELLKDKHPSVLELMDVKEEFTNLSFVDRIPKHIQDDERVRTSISESGTITGRPTSTDPNLLNIPVRTEVGKLIRNGFIASEDYLFVDMDMSQIELRILAHLSMDKILLRAFRRGEDPHQITADRLGIDRGTAKTVNFAVLYKATAKRLSFVLKRSEEECEEIIRDWFKLYAGVDSFFSNTYAECRRHGFVRGLSGRIRYLPNILLPKGSPLRDAAERECGNYKIQEGNAYLIKLAMAAFLEWRRALKQKVRVRPLLQVYDELLMELHIDENFRTFGAVLRKCMSQQAPWFSVPIETSLSVGERWGELK